MEASGPGLLPKTSLVTSKLINYPFTIPAKWTKSMDVTGQTLNTAVHDVTASLGNAYSALEPRGPAKWLMKLFDRTLEATEKSAAIGTRNKDVFWDPFSNGVAGIGQAIASPGAYYYLKKAGMEQPTADAIKAVLDTPLFTFPAPAGGGDVPAEPVPSEPAPSEPAPTEPAPTPTAAVGDAAAGAGQANAA